MRPPQAARADVVVTVTSSPDPVLRGEWLQPGALVCAVGANVADRRELDNTVLERASLVCCDLKAQAQIESGDLIEPIAGGVLDWLEVHELHELITGELQGRQSGEDIVVFKSNGIAAWDVATAAVALERARRTAAASSSDYSPCARLHAILERCRTILHLAGSPSASCWESTTRVTRNASSSGSSTSRRRSGRSGAR